MLQTTIPSDPDKEEAITPVDTFRTSSLAQPQSLAQSLMSNCGFLLEHMRDLPVYLPTNPPDRPIIWGSTADPSKRMGSRSTQERLFDVRGSSPS